ncbi:MAG: hypothetical protein HY040_09865 [Planctomycetes bacterium]|nr:hypothetical protein [Planctomycetota bacterium]
MKSRGARFLGATILGLGGMLLLVSLPALAGGDKDKKKPSAAPLKSYLVRMTVDKEKEAVTSVEILVLTPITKAKPKPSEEITRFDVDSKTQFVLVDGDKKSSFDQKTVLSDAKGKESFGAAAARKDGAEAVIIEANGKTLVSVTMNRKAAKAEPQKDK